jgi:hypothetical protein
MRFMKEKVKEKGSEFRLIHSAEATTVNVIEEIKKRLRWIETPILLDDFKKKLVENLTQPIWGKRPCSTVEVEWDEEPAIDEWKYLGEERDIVYAKTYNIDTIVCDGKKYAVEAEFEYYYTPAGDIVHSFKLIDVTEVKEET